ncbi:cysteine proteinase [Irpex rosettiformis]|uniref:Cysteine proteinase n=1 Tax=Irpex rosettiformis TaxID=378272 RepID=A0ACB8TXM9_9APHY|nr:cysteine proteinase [Irpex rosettiformis]
MDVDLNGEGLDLVGGPFAVIESDPAVFTTLIRKLGIRGLEVTEIYDIEPWATDHLKPRGLIFCYPFDDDEGIQNDPDGELSLDPDAENIWYAYQLSNDTCASQAVLNVVLNLTGVDMEGDLRRFSSETTKMDPIMRGLAVTNCTWIREAHNSLARPADIRGAKHTTTKYTLEYSKKQKAAARKEASGPPAKRRKTARVGLPRRQSATDNLQDSYHFIGYVSRDGRVWELDSLHQGGPLEVGEISAEGGSWMDVVRPAIKRRMQNLISGDNENIRFNLLAIVDDRYEKASDELEMLKREKVQLERRLNEVYSDGWSDKVDTDLHDTASSVFQTMVQSQELGPTFAHDFASRKLEQNMSILEMPQRNLIPAWEKCIRAALTAKVVLDEELSGAIRAHTDHTQRTFDYEPFIQAFITKMHSEGLLEPILTGTKEDTSDKSTGKPIRKQKKR